MQVSKKIVYTIVTEKFLCFAQTLKESFLKYNNKVSFFICVIPENENFAGSELDEIITTSVLDSIEYTDMKSRYDNLALVCALKPYFANYFLNIKNIESIIYLDADIFVYNSFDYLFALLDNDTTQNSIILTPHVIEKLGIDNMVRNINYLTYGAYNAGFFAVKNNRHGKEFISWWKEVLFKYCKNELKYGFFYDQNWLNLVPVYFNEYYTLLTHSGYNVAYWNIDERFINKIENIYYCKNELLVFYHFARFDYFSEELPKNIDKVNPLMLEIFSTYKNNLKENGFENFFIKKEYKSSKGSFLLKKIKEFLKSKLK